MPFSNIRVEDLIKIYPPEDIIQLIDLTDHTLESVLVVPQKNKILAYTHIDNEKLFSNEPETALNVSSPKLFNNPFRKIFGYSGSIFSLVPEELFQEELVELMLSFGHKVPEKQKFFNNYLDLLHLYVIFSMSEKVYSFFTHSGAKDIFHISFSIIRQILINDQYPKNDDLYIGIDTNRITLTAFKEKKLLLQNTYPYQEDEDVLYTILNASHLLGFEPGKSNYTVYGKHSNDQALFTLLKKYIKYAFPVPMPYEIHPHPDEKEVRSYSFFRLLSLLSCA